MIRHNVLVLQAALLKWWQQFWYRLNGVKKARGLGACAGKRGVKIGQGDVEEVDWLMGMARVGEGSWFLA